MKLSVKAKGDFKNTESFLEKIRTRRWIGRLERFGEEGVEALRLATPKDTGKTSESWGYEIRVTDDATTITWTNSSRTDGDTGIPIVVLLYYGHSNGRGGYVEGNDFITPTLKPIFDEIAKRAWKELTKR